MKIYRVVNIDRFQTYQTITIEPVNLSDHLDFEPGQYATLGFYSSGRPTPMRPFSITTSPRSAKLQFAMRPYGKFTSKIRKLRPGDRINLQGPFGNFIVDHSQDESLVLLAAGIGITPMMSIIRDACARNLSIPIKLIYSNNDAEVIPYNHELLGLMSTNPNFEVVFTVSNGQHNPAERIYAGRINRQIISEICGRDLDLATYFVCGPSGYIRNTTKMLKSLGVDQAAILSESFAQKRSFSLSFTKFGIQARTLAAATASILMIAGLVGTTDLLRGTDKASAFKAVEQALEGSDEAAESEVTSAASSAPTGSTATDTSGTSTSTNNSAPTSQTPTTYGSSSYSQSYVSPSSGVS